jgi:hypothetical protein
MQLQTAKGLHGTKGAQTTENMPGPLTKQKRARYFSENMGPAPRTPERTSSINPEVIVSTGREARRGEQPEAETARKVKTKTASIANCCSGVVGGQRRAWVAGRRGATGVGGGGASSSDASTSAAASGVLPPKEPKARPTADKADKTLALRKNVFKTEGLF